MRFWKSYICSSKLDVQETNCCFSQLNRISLDTGLRLDGLPALELWDLIVSVLGNTTQYRIERRDPLLNKREVCSPTHTIHKRKQSQRVINDLDNVDFIPSNV